ncbi:hypothetical protein SAMN02745687_02209 [Lachnospiraceae bacterium NK3A20]|nr:hypothetical protein SAMN02745687_02209 [Lachnospiraceae bacterium NK3A20]
MARMKELKGRSVVLREGRLVERAKLNREYLMSLENRYLTRNFDLEAGRFTNREIDVNAMGGWESPTCQLRGHFLGHWLSAAALYYEQTGDMELKAKADAVVAEIAACQKDNGGQWAASIPEKYLYWIAAGRNIWAPQYTIHKLLMGLVDLYLYAGNDEALEVADHFADWFDNWSAGYTREEFDNILDYETGGMLEIWAELLEITGSEKYRRLLSRYYRARLFEPLLQGEDVLTNMHANTTIPEILGCARAYEATGDEKWLEIVKAYWKCAVTDRGCFATGGQTQGEIWTPKMKLKARLGKRNQEHCTVYNMMRLAQFLFLETQDPAFLQYMEYNLYNGIMAQSYYRAVNTESNREEKGLLTYFLPMQAVSRKGWSGEMDSFFCCHGTMVQANARLNEGIYYQDGSRLYVGQYLNSDVEFELTSGRVRIEQREDTMNGLLQSSSENNVAQTVNEIAGAQESRPGVRKYVFTVRTKEPSTFTLALRIPEWIRAKALILVNGVTEETTADSTRFAEVYRVWEDGDQVTVILPIGLSFVALPDDASMGAFRYGPEVLVGVTSQERILRLPEEDEGDPTKELVTEDERQWGQWNVHFRTEHQEPGISFVPINEIGYEPYQMYFKVEDRD